MRARAALLILGAALVAGCSHRDHANPLDPLNPDTGGRPAGFQALADNGFVQLVWQPNTNPGVLGFQLARRISGSGSFVVFPGTRPPSSSGTVDVGLANGTTYEYQLSYVFERGLGPLPAVDHATPGPTHAWAADHGAGALRRLTADGHHVLLSVAAFSTPAELATDPKTGALWVSDPRAGTLTAYYENGAHVDAPGLNTPGFIAVDPGDNSAWVSDPGSSQVLHFLATGNPGTPASLGPLDNPAGLAVDPADHSLWLCEYGGNLVRRFSTTGAQLGIATVASPECIAIDSLTRTVWVTSPDYGRIVRLTSSMVPIDTLRGFSAPVGIAIDNRRGRIWVADFDAGAVVTLDRSGAVQSRAAGMPGARIVAVDLATGEGWVAARALQSVVHLSASGVVLESSGGFVDPTSVAIVSGR